MPQQVLVLAGGDSEEREISLRSGAAVAKALRSGGYTVSVADPADGLENLLPQMKAVDVLFPALHGAGGEDGTLQRFLEQHDIRFVGSGSEASALCFDKARYAELLKQHDIRVPETSLVDFERFKVSPIIKQPFVLKPHDGGSSIDNIIVRDVVTKDETAIKSLFEKRGQLLLQSLITGVEITIPILGSESLPVIEIVPPANKEFDYENKYNGATQEICPPEHVNTEQQENSQKLALQIHELCSCRGMSRTDIIINQVGEIYVLETNTIPGLTDESLLPKAAAVAGITMPELCDRLVKDALGTASA